MGFILDALWRMHQQASHHRRWFCIDKPARIAAGYVPDGLTDKERSEADKERLPPDHDEYKAPDKLNPCAAELRRRHGG
jgi:hypothetical protein